MNEDFGTPFGATTLLAGAPSPAAPEPARQAARIAVGLSGARQNAAVAVCVDGALLAFCEQERVTRVRRAAAAGALPAEALEVALRAAGCAGSAGVMTYATADDVRVPVGVPLLSLDHHAGHAAAAFRLSSYEAAAVLVCDRRKPLSVWQASPGALVERTWAASSDGLARLYSEGAGLFGFGSGQEHELEGLARLDTGAEASRLEELIVYRDGSLWASAAWKEHIADWLAAGPPHDLRHRARVASALQRRLGDLLVSIAADVREHIGLGRLCLGGGLFYNTYFTTRVRQSGLFDDVSTPPNPGNAGTAIGAAFSAFDAPVSGGAISPFLGPAYDAEAIKRTLDNCKLSYEHLDDGDVVDMTARALARGQLVGWFQGRMEWGHRALGNRSILANPLSPYVLDNLNVYLKHRPRHRAYGVSVREEDAARFFAGPPTSRFMEYDYAPLDPDALRFVMPEGATTLRVQTVPARPGDEATARFRLLHERFGQASGLPVLVNTSFNGFAEPMVCSPRDAIRVFFGTGLDLLVLDRFVLRK